jgi:hypothetical protein
MPGAHPVVDTGEQLAGRGDLPRLWPQLTPRELGCSASKNCSGRSRQTRLTSTLLPHRSQSALPLRPRTGWTSRPRGVATAERTAPCEARVPIAER